MKQITENDLEIHQIMILIWEMLQKHYMLQNPTCAQHVSLYQNSEMFQNTAQSVYLLQNSVCSKMK